MTDLDAIWLRHAVGRAAATGRPSFRHDPLHAEAAAAPPEPSPTLYRSLRRRDGGIDRVIGNLVTDPELRGALRAGVAGAHELAFELMALGDPVDRAVSDFSAAHYLRHNPDIRAAGLDPLSHYVLTGERERRWTLGDQRRLEREGGVRFDAARPTCLVGIHDMSRNGAPVVGLDLAREAAATHNVIVVAPHDGDLAPEFLATSWRVLVTSDLLADASRAECLRQVDVDLAVLNSVESARHIPWLVAAGVPFASYVHEYEDYTDPPDKLTDVALYSDLVVFSSESQREAWAPVLDEVAFDRRDSRILPQRRLVAGHPGAEALREARLGLSGTLGRDLTRARIVCGAGRLQWRKGVDLFVAAARAARAMDPDALFVWIGDGLDPRDADFGVWLWRQAVAAGLDDPEGNLRLLPAGPDYPRLLAAADAMFLSSRLDPLPNVAFDAARNGCRIVAFEGATGFDDPGYRDSGLFTYVPRDDALAAARALTDLPRKAPDGAPPVGEGRVPVFGPIRRELARRLAERRHFVAGAARTDASRLFGDGREGRAWRVREQEKLHGARRRAIWRDPEDARRALARSDDPAHGATTVRALGHGPVEAAPPSRVHIHAGDPADVAGLLQGHVAIRRAGRIIVTTGTTAAAEGIGAVAQRLGANVRTVVVPNLGSGLHALFDLARLEAEDTDGWWTHIAAQPPRRGEARWRRPDEAGLRVLLGDATALSPALAIVGGRGIGLVAPLSPVAGLWGASRTHRGHLEARLGAPLPTVPLVVPEGNLMLVAADVVQRMDALFGPKFPWPSDPGLDKGAGDAALSRLWPAVAAQCGRTSVFVHACTADGACDGARAFAPTGSEVGG